MRASLLAALACAVVLLCAVGAQALTSGELDVAKGTVQINETGMYVYNTGTSQFEAYSIRGVAYSVVPIGETERAFVMGDYFTADYAYVWARDFPRLVAMGINTLRIYYWNALADHKPFLDTCAQFGLKVMVTHGIGYAINNPVDTLDRQKALIQNFADEVARLGDHPAILMWSFGNELNGYWLGFLDQFNTMYKCDWNTQYAILDNNGVQTNDGCITSRTPACIAKSNCVYSKYFTWINDALGAAKQHTTRPMTATFADIDNIVSTVPDTDLLPRMAPYLTNFDAYAFQLYRGKSFYPPGAPSYFAEFEAEAGGKMLIVSEYGFDAMNDPCGWWQNYPDMTPCSVYTPGQNGQPGGSDIPEDPSTFVGCYDGTAACAQPGVVSQASWDAGLTQEIKNNWAANTAEDSATNTHTTLGGFVFEWIDEYWKNVETQDFCAAPVAYSDVASATAALVANPTASPYYAKLASPVTGAANCTYKAHITCNNPSNFIHDVCGYFLDSAPDQYVNEAWFGVNKVADCNQYVTAADGSISHRLNALTARPVATSLQTVYGGQGSVEGATCTDMNPCWTCVTSNTEAAVALGNCNSQCGLKLDHVLVSYTDGSTTTPAATASTGTSSSGSSTTTGTTSTTPTSGSGSTTTGTTSTTTPTSDSSTTGAAAGGSSTTPTSGTTAGSSSLSQPSSATAAASASTGLALVLAILAFAFRA